MDATRRGVLLGAAVGASGLAGCLGDGGNGETEGASLDEHPAGRGLSDQPVLGPAPAEAPAVIVGFEDPSCSTCRRFERNTYPRIREKLVGPGTAAFAYRAIPVVYPWGEPAVHALEATHARDEDVFWSLKDHYYAEQEQFDTDNVLPRTESFLDAETDLDAGAVVADAREQRYDDAVQANLDAGEDAGANGVPTFFLFRDGTFRTKVTGPQSYDVFANALDV